MNTSMSALVRVLSGARAGHVLRCDGTLVIRVGREAGLELRFDPQEDRDVSARHATITLDDTRWLITDLQSRNGTYVNGRKIDAPTQLADGDQIAFGAKGPLAEIRLFDADRTIPFPPSPSTDSDDSTATTDARATTLQREIPRQTSRRWTALGFALAVCSAAGLTFLRWNETRAWERERTALLTQVETALASRDANADLSGLAIALRESRAAVRDAADKLRSAERARDLPKRRELQDTLRRSLTTLGQQLAAAGLDREHIRLQNERAVAKVFAESPSGEVVTGTAFAVRPDGVMITSAHIVADTAGLALTRIAVQFSNSDQVWTARVLSLNRDDDLAVIKVDSILGAVPTVRAFNRRADTVRAGVPVLMIGYPLGGTLSPSRRDNRVVVTPVVDAGSVTAVAGHEIQVRGYGTFGSSGSPIFDSRGEVVAIAFGGKTVADIHYTIARSAAAAATLLARTVRDSAPP